MVTHVVRTSELKYQISLGLEVINVHGEGNICLVDKFILVESCYDML